MISILASGLVFAGILMLVAALCTVRTLIARLPQGALRRYWSALTALIVLFVVAYMGYAIVFWNRHTELLDFIVPVVFFFGACFVFLTTSLSLRTARDVLRISALERETVTDSLTGVLNRRYLDRRLNEQISSARRYGPTSRKECGVELHPMTSGSAMKKASQPQSA